MVIFRLFLPGTLRDEGEAGMQFAGRLNEQDIADARVLVPAKGQEARTLSLAFRGAVVVGVPALVTYKFLTVATRPNWWALAALWLFALGCGALLVYVYKSGNARVAARLKLPDRIDLNDDGIKMSRADGASTFHPWANVTDWREGRRVVVLMQSTTDILTILPVGDLSDAARQPLRDLLKTHVVASPVAR
jgi:hypothetical protein